MAETTKARGQVTIVDLNDGTTMNMYLVASRSSQIHDSDGRESATSFNPNFVETPLVITPELYVTGGGSTNMMNTSDVSSVEWFINDVKVLSAYDAEAETQADIYYTTRSDGGHKLTIQKNMTDDSQWTITCKCKYTDPSSKAETVCMAFVSILRADTQGSSFSAVITTGEGGNVWSGDELELTFYAHLFQGIHEQEYKAASGDTPATMTFKWYHWCTNPDHKWEEIKAGIENDSKVSLSGNSITVHRDFVVNCDSFKVEITDTESGTTVASPILNAWDNTDEYDIKVYTLSGDVITKGAPTTTIITEITKNGVEADKPEGASYLWTMYDSNGIPAPFLCDHNGNDRDDIVRKEDGTVDSSVLANYVLKGDDMDSIKIHRKEISVRATIFCSLVLPA